MHFYDSIGSSKPKPSSAPYAFRSKEWFKDLRLIFFLNTGTCILNCYDYVLKSILKEYVYKSSMGHCFKRVFDQVGEYLGHLLVIEHCIGICGLISNVYFDIP